jgi:hypothetical protein
MLWMMGWPSRYTNMSEGNVSDRPEEFDGAGVCNGHIVETGLDSGTWLSESMFAQAEDTL